MLSIVNLPYLLHEMFHMLIIQLLFISIESAGFLIVITIISGGAELIAVKEAVNELRTLCSCSRV